MRQLLHRITQARRGRFVAGLIIGSLLAGGVAVAAIPNSTTGQITACYRTSGYDKGVLRVAEGSTCPTGSAKIAWQSKGMRYAGTWSNTGNYSVNDIVAAGGASYIARRANIGVAVTNPAYWAVVAAKGATGATGRTGPTHGRTVLTDHVATTAGGYTQGMALTIGASGYPVMAWSEVSGEVKVASCHDVACVQTPTIATIDTGLTSRPEPSLVIGNDGNPVIAFSEYKLEGIGVSFPPVVVACLDPECGQSTSHVIDPRSMAMISGALTIGPDGFPTVVYGTQTSGGTLVIAHCSDATCTAPPTITDIATPNYYWASPAVGADGFLTIAVQAYTTPLGTLSTVHCTNVTCSTHTQATLDATGTKVNGSALAFGVDGAPLITYTGDDAGTRGLGLARCNNGACTAANFVSLNPADDTGQMSALAIDPDGHPIIATIDSRGAAAKVLITRCSDNTCTAPPTSTTVATSRSVDIVAIAIGSDGAPIVAYVETDTFKIHLIHLGRSTWTAGGYGG
jgi:hypothetical protein